MMPHVEGGVCNLNPTRVRGRTLWFRRAQNSRRQAFHHRRRVPSAAADAGSLASCRTTNAHGAGLSFSDATAVTDGRTRLCVASTPSLSESPSLVAGAVHPQHQRRTRAGRAATRSFCARPIAHRAAGRPPAEIWRSQTSLSGRRAPATYPCSHRVQHFWPRTRCVCTRQLRRMTTSRRRSARSAARNSAIAEITQGYISCIMLANSAINVIQAKSLSVRNP